MKDPHYENFETGEKQDVYWPRFIGFFGRCMRLKGSYLTR